VSLIDDALKRAQAAGESEARSPVDRPWVPAPLPDESLARRRRLLRALAIALLVALAAGGAIFLMRREGRGDLPLSRGERRAQGVTSATAVPQPTAVSAALEPKRAGTAKPRPTRPPLTPAQGTPEAEAAIPTPASPSSVPERLTNGKTYIGSVALAGGARIELGGIAWSESEPRALVNDRVVAVGAYVEGFSVSTIEPDRVALEKGGLTIYLSVR
jgi:hypothetical protein